MKITDDEAAAFTEAYRLYQEECGNAAGAYATLQQTGQDARAALKESPIAVVAGEDFERWDPDVASRRAAVLEQLGQAHMAVGLATCGQAKALRKTSEIMTEFVERSKTEHGEEEEQPHDG